MRIMNGSYTGDMIPMMKHDGRTDLVYHGNGTFVYNNGDVYKGEFRHGNRRGQGIINYGNGNCQKKYYFLS